MTAPTPPKSLSPVAELDEDAQVATEYFRRAFQHLTECDKRSPAHSDAVLLAFLQHAKSYRPQLLLALKDSP